MPNYSVINGLQPVYEGNGSPWSGKLTRYFVPSTDATALFRGDPVILAGSADANGVATVTRASVGGRVTGVVVGFDPSPTIIANGSRLASTAEYVLVADAPGTVFEIQEDAVGGALAAVDVGLNADIIIGTGNRITGSGVQLDTSTKATSNALAFRIRGFVQRADNEIGANAKVLVTINLPTEPGLPTGTGI